MLCSKQVFGILVCDIHVPRDEEDGGTLQRCFEDFAPIIQHANVNYKDIWMFMQEVSTRSNITVRDR